ncbi:heteromeric transposase endonuclease subunit TnsA [Domibacillus enclensis]|uniref:Heteromeric transposase endonuclease subunit TnsA n=1 Tax=Domibacillus enclensis TaxID=1017273 RepID=A0A1N7AHW2_9BACI|nr:heteromeric transposase endonuclease subunit TnsA [Domibacillus enclensis]OXS75826.1 heteromeric transposase endonuclease subunit TnsA [Domibacillus enclensis]SIR38629.1 TnsA endonuclease C terminal [Domibacillus enclensis]
MAKRTRSNSIDKKLKDGRGQGIEVNYTPWLKIQDVSSSGRATRLKGMKIPRQFEFLSDLEQNYFYLLEYSDLVIDIREQYPLLPIEETLLIAEELGIIHPRDPKTKEPIVMTTDFLVTVSENKERKEYARTVKSKNDLMNERVLEKFEIERVFWKRRNVDWSIVTEKEIHKTMAFNIKNVREYKELHDIEGFDMMITEHLEDLIIDYIGRLLTKDDSIRALSYEFEKDFDLLLGSGIGIFKHLVINKIIEVDLLEKIDVNQAIPIKAVHKDFSQKVKSI